MRKEDIDPKIQKWANLMVEHSLGTQFRKKNDSIEGKLVVVSGEYTTEQLMIAFSHALLKSGAHPYLNVRFPTHQRGTVAGLPEIESGTPEQLSYVPEFMRTMVGEAGANIHVLGTSHPFLMQNYGKQLSEIGLANKELKEIRLNKPWTLTLYPTDAEAVLEGFDSVGAYRNFIIDASIVDYAQMAIDQEVIKNLLDEATTVRLRTYDAKTNKTCNLEIEIGNNIVESCIGTHNVPDGEVFTSPNTSRINGEVVLDVPVMYDGAEIAGVYLKIQDGRIIEYRAAKGEKTLHDIVETDNGSHRMGEIAVGTNPKIQRSLKHPLFAEKIGGTCHMAIGSPYDDSYRELVGLNSVEKESMIAKLIADGRYHKSAQHVDIPTDFRNPVHGQALYIGNTEVKWDTQKGAWNPVK